MVTEGIFSLLLLLTWRKRRLSAQKAFTRLQTENGDLEDKWRQKTVQMKSEKKRHIPVTSLYFCSNAVRLLFFYINIYFKIMKSTFLNLLFYIISVYAVKTFGASCRHGEYLSTDGECCPMCNIGLVVLRDCIGDYSTTCIPCTKGTFMNVRNRRHSCFPCKTCDGGFHTLQNCSTINDTVCEVLDGYYCAQHSDGECSLAMKHSECKPGEQIKTPGTRVSDTVCEMCPSGFYSPEGVRCFKWTELLQGKPILTIQVVHHKPVSGKIFW